MNIKKTQRVYAVILTGQRNDLSIILDQTGQSFLGIERENTQNLNKESLLDCLINFLNNKCQLPVLKNNAVELSARYLPAGDIGEEIYAFCYLFHLERDQFKIEHSKNNLLLRPLVMLKRLNLNFGAILCEAIGKFWRHMPSFDSSVYNVALPDFLVKKKIHHLNDRLIFYGGTFRPWHKGHLQCILSCPENDIIVVPDSNPWKDDSRKDFNRCFWQDCRAIALKLKDTKYAVYPGFCGKESENPTVDWIENVRVQKKGLLMGDDSFMQILDWKKAQRLMTLLEIIYVLPRIHTKEERLKQKNKLIKLNPTLEVVLLEDHSYMNLSSTQLRLSIKNES